MPNVVQVDFVGNVSQLFATTDQVAAKLRASDQQFRNFGSSVASNISEPVKKASTEVDRINRQTALSAKKNADILTTLTKNRVNAELALERSLEKSKENLFKQSVNARIAAMRQQDAASRSRGGFQNAAGLASGVAGSLGIGIGVSSAIGLGTAAIDRAVEASRANRVLASSALEAGLAFNTAAEQNKRFAESLGLSERQAASTTAAILRLSARSGSKTDPNKLLGGFADLGSAFGIDPKDLQTLIGTILSGQDEGLNRLGIADPGQLYKAYAKELGKTVEQLTQMEKVQAAVNAVMDKAATFAGAASDRMNSLEGRVAKTAAAWDTFTTSLSTSFAQSSTVTDFLDTVNRAVNSLGVSVEDVTRKLKEGQSAGKIARDANQNPSLEDFGRAGVTAIGAGTLGPALGQTFFDAINPFKIRDRRVADLTEQITSTDALNKKQSEGAKQKAAADAEKIAAEQRVSAELAKRDAINKEIEAAGKRDLDAVRQRLDVEKAKISVGDNQLEIIRKIAAAEQSALNQQIALYDKIAAQKIQALSPADFAKGQDRVIRQDFIEQKNQIVAQSSVIAINARKAEQEEIKKAQDKVKDLGEQYKETFAQLSGRANSDNPFVRIFSDSDKALTDLRKNLAGLKPELLASATAMQNKITGREVFGARLDSKLDAANFRNKAADFRNAYRDQLLGEYNPDFLESLKKKESQQRLRDQIDIINRPNLTADQRSIADSRLISLAGNLDPRSLSFNDSEAVASAFERKAVETERREIEALREQQTQSKILTQIEAGIQKLQGVARSGGAAAVEVLIKNESENATVDKKPKAANQNDVRDQYDPYGIFQFLPGGGN